jgi:hypothetical protein
MQFEPRLFSPEPAAANPNSPALTTDLPDELAALAEQLQDDAGRLAAQYASTAAPRTAGRRRAWVAAVAAVSFCTGLAGGAWSAWTPSAGERVVGSDAGRRQTRSLGPALSAPARDLRVVREQEGPLSGAASAASAFVSAGPKALPRAQRPLVRDEAALLRRQVAAFEQVIERLQAELRERADQQSHTNATVAELRREIAELRGRLESQPTLSPN